MERAFLAFARKPHVCRTKCVVRNEMENRYKKGMSSSSGNTQAKTPTLFNRKE